MNMRHSLVSLLLLTTASGLQASDPDKGKALVNENCVSCHGNEVYTRSDRKVKTPDGLRKQVQRCELALGLSWFDDQIDNASAYLNSSFYKFK